jgi:hypothetical protein
LSTDAVRLVTEYVEARPKILDDKNKVVEGLGWDQTRWPGGHFPVAVRTNLAWNSSHAFLLMTQYL